MGILEQLRQELGVLREEKVEQEEPKQEQEAAEEAQAPEVTEEAKKNEEVEQQPITLEQAALAAKQLLLGLADMIESGHVKIEGLEE